MRLDDHRSVQFWIRTNQKGSALPFDSGQPEYEALQEIVAERTDPLVLWVGAGLSAQAGLPTWGELRETLHEALESKAKTQEKVNQKALLSTLDAIENIDNTWLALQRLKDNLGETSWRAAIRDALKAAPSAEIPDVYHQVWRLRPAGIINLNLDRLATRAFSSVYEGTRSLNEVTGYKAGDRLHILKHPQPFVVNAHGNANDYSSWVLTRKSLNALTQNDGYRNFIRSCLASKVVLFIGLSPEDVAVDGHLSKLREITRDTGDHYWITDRRDAETDAWAEDAGLRVIRYRSIDGDHSALGKILQGLVSFVSEDEPAPPVTRKATSDPQDLPVPADLLPLSANEIRRKLDSAASAILEPRTKEAYKDYSDFRAKYDQAIHRAWYLDDIQGRNQLFDYTLEEEVAEGAFGKVYRAQDNGDTVAIKVLHEAMRNEEPALESFRRGIYSMEILDEHDIEGVVSYRDAGEIPTFVVMDWVEGPTLTEAIEARFLDTWHELLTVFTQVTTIIRKAHSLPERVLHRDIRPNNIILRGYYTEPEFDLVVLDFDLSWHLGSVEKSVVRDSAPTSYLAPEQLQEIEGVSTRHAAVDSFGLGMTFFHALSNERPVPSQHKHKDWKQTILQAAQDRVDCEWQSLPRRIARLIWNATQHEQNERWDIAQILGELELLHEALLKPTEVRSAKMIAQELAARTRFADQMGWDPDTSKMELTIPSGARVEVTAGIGAGLVKVRLIWESTGDFDHKRVSKWIPSASDQAAAKLRGAGWSVAVNRSGDRIAIDASKEAKSVVQDLDRQASSLTDAIDALTFR